MRFVRYEVFRLCAGSLESGVNCVCICGTGGEGESELVSCWGGGGDLDWIV